MATPDEGGTVMTRSSALRCAVAGSAGLLAAALPGSPAPADTEDLIEKAVTEQVTGELLDRVKDLPTAAGTMSGTAAVSVEGVGSLGVCVTPSACWMFTSTL